MDGARRQESPIALLSARYEDQLVPKQGRSLFARRVVRAMVNRPVALPKP